MIGKMIESARVRSLGERGMAKGSIAAAIFSTIIEHCSSYEIAVAVSRFWEPNNGVRSSIAESDADIEVERTPKITNDLSGTTSFPATSNKVTISSLEVKDFFEPSLLFIITVGFSDLAENSHFHISVEHWWDGCVRMPSRNWDTNWIT
jgi:hypothetical protein